MLCGFKAWRGWVLFDCTTLLPKKIRDFLKVLFSPFTIALVESDKDVFPASALCFFGRRRFTHGGFLMLRSFRGWFLSLGCCLFLLIACGNPADRAGIGAACTADVDCKEEGQKCLTNFRGGYCGSEGCVKDADCPTGAACVTHTDTKNYCFRVCNDKPDCNANRTAENESNCSANITLVSGDKGKKVCVPPSGA